MTDAPAQKRRQPRSRSARRAQPSRGALANRRWREKLRAQGLVCLYAYVPAESLAQLRRYVTRHTLAYLAER